MFGQTPPVVKNLLIINILMFLLTGLGEQTLGFNLSNLLGLHHWSSELFNPIQFVTYIFMHGSTTHILFNMFGLWMFGRVLEQVWDPKRFLIFFIVTGMGAGLVQLTIQSFELNALEKEFSAFQSEPSVEGFERLFTENRRYVHENIQYEIVDFYNNRWLKDPYNSSFEGKAIAYSTTILNEIRNMGTVGASGSLMGILLAFGMLFPNVELLLLIPPIPIKAKYLVILMAAMDLFLGIANQPGDNVAHFAHLGGMLFGYLLIRYWRNNTKSYY